jgi:hypothetical protein
MEGVDAFMIYRPILRPAPESTIHDSIAARLDFPIGMVIWGLTWLTLSCNSGGFLITERTCIGNARGGFVSSTVLLSLELSLAVERGKAICVFEFCVLACWR